MFWNKKKTQLEILIEKDGLDHAANRIAEIINEKIGSLDVARQFVLEELDAARQGDSEALRFVQASGFKPDEYIGAMSNSFEEVDGTDGPQMFLNNLMMSQLMHNRDLMTSFRIAITDKIMQMWNLGKYQNASSDQNNSAEYLIKAVTLNKYDETINLIKLGADLSYKNERSLTALHVASFRNNLAIVEKLLEHGADINVQDKYGATPLIAATIEGHTEIVKALD